AASAATAARPHQVGAAVAAVSADGVADVAAVVVLVRTHRKPCAAVASVAARADEHKPAGVTTVTCDGVTQRVGDGAPAVAAATRSGTVAAVAAVGAGADRVIVRSRYAVGDADPVVGDCQAALPAIASGGRSTGCTAGTTRQQEAEQAARSQDAAQATVASVATTCIEVGGGAPTPVAAVAAEAEQQAATPTVASVAAGDALICGHGGGHGVCAVLAADVAAVTPVTAVAEQETAPA